MMGVSNDMSENEERINRKKEKARLRAAAWRLANPGRGKEWRANNKEHIKNYSTQYHEAHREISKPVKSRAEKKRYLAMRDSIFNKAKQWYVDNKDRYALNQKRYRIKHRVERAAYRIIYESLPENIVKRAVYNQARRSRKRNAVGSYTPEELINLYKQQKGKCANCKIKISDRKYSRNRYHADHVVPLSKGGTNYIQNIQLLCRECNLSKSALDPDEWAARNGRLFC
jgi:5-methylcytosine-specific restriction endonuclease McrA